MARKLRPEENIIFVQALKAADQPAPALEEFFERLKEAKANHDGPELGPASAGWFGEEAPEVPS